MKVVFLGTGGFHPNERRHTASVMLPEAGIVFDAGTGSFRIPRYLQTQELDIFLSHAHLDHIFGLTSLIVPLLRGTISHLRIHGSAATLEAVQQHLFAESIFPVALPNCSFEPLGAAVTVAGGVTVTYRLLDHPGGSMGYRAEWASADGQSRRSLAFITDTTAPGDYADFVRGVDALIHECYFPDADHAWAGQTGHSNTTPVVQLAKEAGVGDLYLIHIDPQREEDDPLGLDAARQIFTRTHLAEDLQEVTL